MSNQDYEIERLKNTGAIISLKNSIEKKLWDAKGLLEKASHNGFNKFYYCLAEARVLMDRAVREYQEVERIKGGSSENRND